MHTETIAYTVTNPGAGGAAAAAVTGDSLTIKNNRGVSGPRIIDFFGQQATAGFQQIVFPTGHDTTRGYRVGQIPDDTYTHIPPGMSIPVTAQETITVTVAGGGAETDVGALTVHYPDLPGIDQRALTWSQLQSRYEQMTTVFSAVTSGAGAWGTAVLINAVTDLLKANRDYALLGITTTVDQLAVALTGPDTGNVRIGAPGSNQNTDEASCYFGFMARANGLACIPVINSGNKASTSLQSVAATAVATNATLYLALLRKSS
jgi:hypothetical protein